VETNRLIAEWVGFEVEPLTISLTKERWMSSAEDKKRAAIEGCDPYVTPLPDYQHSNAAAIELLPVLVEKYKDKSVKVMLESMSSNDEWFFTIGLMEDGADDYTWYESDKKPTISATICAAIIQLIEKGEGNE